MFNFIEELSKIEIVFNYNCEDESTFKSYVKNIESDYILVDDFLFSKGVQHDLPSEIQVKVFYKRKTGVYSGNCDILGRDNSKLTGIKISFPTDIKFIQMREFLRVSLALKTEVVFFPDSDKEDVKIYQASTIDISGSGFCFVSDQPVKKQTKIVGIINLSDPKEAPIEVPLKYIYSQSFIGGGKERYKNAFTFDGINDNSRDKILKEIWFYEIQMRKKGL